jgi:hypothetical protein
MRYRIALYWGIYELFVVPVPENASEEAESSFNFIKYITGWYV